MDRVSVWVRPGHGSGEVARFGWAQGGGVIWLAERVKYPGYRWAFTGTHDWENPQGPFHWATYPPPDANGFCLRESGFADTRKDAERRAKFSLRGTA